MKTYADYLDETENSMLASRLASLPRWDSITAGPGEPLTQENFRKFTEAMLNQRPEPPRYIEGLDFPRRRRHGS